MELPEFMRRAAGPLEVKPEHKLISAYFNVDNGTGKIRGVYTQGNAAIAPIFAQWIAPLKDLGVTTITNRNTGGTDHLSFDAVGIPGFQFIQEMLDYESRTHHSNEDVYERLQPADLKQIATVEAIFLYNAAQRDQMLPRKPLAATRHGREEARADRRASSLARFHQRNRRRSKATPEIGLRRGPPPRDFRRGGPLYFSL